MAGATIILALLSQAIYDSWSHGFAQASIHVGTVAGHAAGRSIHSFGVSSTAL